MDELDGSEDWPALSPDQFEARVAELLEEAEGQPFEWWYLSFADREHFRGGLYIEARTGFEAVLLASERGVNPGGEVMMWGPIPPESLEVVPESDRNRLLSKEEVEK